METLTLQELIDALVYERDHSTAMPTTKTDVERVGNVVDGGGRRILCGSTYLGRTARQWAEIVGDLEDELAEAQERLG